MKLYHGTRSRFLPSILKNGLKPRGRTKGNWDKFPSHLSMVYLSVAYPFYFALTTKAGKQHKPIVIEFESDSMDESKFYPDEDFIAQGLMQQDQKFKAAGLEATHNEVRKNLEEYQHHWELSLKHIGNVCYKGIIPRSAITRICEFDYKKRNNGSVLGLMMDPMISIMNYKFVGDKYRNLVAWMFDDTDELTPDTSMQMILDNGDDGSSIYKMMLERKKAWLEEAADRSGITITRV